MDRLWTPWRYSYITRADPEARSGVPEALNAWPSSAADDKHCVFCNMIAAVDYAIAHGMPRETAEQAVHLVHRGQHCFVCLNAYPYSTGHVMIVPYQHLSSLAVLPPEAANEMMTLAQRSELALRNVYNPGGLNVGLNLGKVSGGSLAEHLHMHVVPRWVGDANFITIIGGTKMIPQLLRETRQLLATEWANQP